MPIIKLNPDPRERRIIEAYAIGLGVAGLGMTIANVTQRHHIAAIGLGLGIVATAVAWPRGDKPSGQSR